MIKEESQKINRDLNSLAPVFRNHVVVALSRANDAGYPIKVFEAYRSPERQSYLYAKGRSIPGKIVTNAVSWRSWHNYGLAIDIAFFKDELWSWDGDFDKVAQYFLDQGLKWLSPIEKVHFEMSDGLDLRRCEMIAKRQNLAAVWNQLKEKD